MKHNLLTLLLLLFVISNANSQNGKIVEKKPYVIADSSIAKLEKIIPNAKALVSNVDFFKITYLSDGLKVAGYMSVPKKPGNYPCVIFNRGGNILMNIIEKYYL